MSKIKFMSWMDLFENKKMPYKDIVIKVLVTQII